MNEAVLLGAYWLALIASGSVFLWTCHQDRKRFDAAVRREKADALAKIEEARQFWLKLKGEAA